VLVEAVMPLQGKAQASCGSKTQSYGSSKIHKSVAAAAEPPLVQPKVLVEAVVPLQG
jgi:hypothetical protein